LEAKIAGLGQTGFGRPWDFSEKVTQRSTVIANFVALPVLRVVLRRVVHIGFKQAGKYFCPSTHSSTQEHRVDNGKLEVELSLRN
jgi:hypothetical protein